MAQFGHDQIQLLALRQTQSDTAIARQVAGAGQNQITHPRQAHECFGAPAQGDAEPADFGQTACDQGRPRIEAEL